MRETIFEFSYQAQMNGRNFGRNWQRGILLRIKDCKPEIDS